VGREPADSFPFGRDPRQLARRTIGNYWPYATTLYDYVSRAMPLDAPGSLPPRSVYAVVAYLLHRNGIVPRGRGAERPHAAAGSDAGAGPVRPRTTAAAAA
jgi:cytochrome c